MENNFDIKKIGPIKKFYYKYLKSKLKNDTLSASHVVFVDALSKQKFHSQQELTEYIGCNKAHTSRTLLAMKLKGIIKPTYSQNVIELTEKGKKYVEKLNEIDKDFANIISVNVTETERKIFNNVLNKFISNANRI